MDLYTRCPHCQTVFRLAAEQLDAAGGRVRCGACLRVFPARNSLVRPKAAATPTSARPAAPATSRPATVTPPAPTPAPIPAPQLDFDSFFGTPAAAPAPASPPPAVPAAAATPATNAAPPTPDFSLLAEALNALQTPAPEEDARPAQPPLTATPVEATPPIESAPPAVTAPAADKPAEPATPVVPAKPAAAAAPINAAAIADAARPAAEILPKPTRSPATETAPVDPIAASPLRPAPPMAREEPPSEPLPEAVPESAAAPRQATVSTTSEHEPLLDSEPAAEELPDDWAAFKRPVRNEPVFDDDNGLEWDAEQAGARRNEPSWQAAPASSATEHDAAAMAAEFDALIDAPTPAAKAATAPALVAEAEAASMWPDDSLTPETPTAIATPIGEPEPVDADDFHIDDIDAFARDEIDAPPQTAPIEAEPALAPATKAESTAEPEEWFELHLDAVEAAAEPTVFADWHLDHSETVPLAEDEARLTPSASSRVTSPMPPASPTAERRPTAATPPARADNNGDFGDISDALDQPEVPLRAPLYGKVNPRVAPTTPEPFDRDSFTAEADDRVYAHDSSDGLDGIDTSDSQHWSIEAIQPAHDLEQGLYPPARRRWPWRGLLLTVLALLLLPVLVLQLLWPQRALLREDPQWGSWVETVCRHIDCELPPRSDVRKIELQQRSVLKDRNDARKLQIDLLIANKASFAQPYPDINLRFTNIEGELVAERRFKPSEYLREQPDSSQMPVGVPVHIAFGVKAPEGNITGYEFQFLPPQP